MAGRKWEWLADHHVHGVARGSRFPHWRRHPAAGSPSAYISSTRRPSVARKNRSEDLLALLSPERILHTIAHFPQQRRIIPQEGKELLYRDKEEVEDLSRLYDPCYLLPLFSTMLQSDCVVNCFKFVSSHALGLTVAALSSYDGKVRAAGYHVLSSFYAQLEGTASIMKRQLLYLLEMMKNGIRKQNVRLPFILTTYVSRVAQQMLKPEGHMYVVLNKFLLSHQSLDFRSFPGFFKLFHSSDLEVQIVRVLVQAGRVPRGAYHLTRSCGLLAWVLHLLRRRTLEPRLLCGVVDLLHVLWSTNLGRKDQPQTDRTQTDQPQTDQPQTDQPQTDQPQTDQPSDGPDPDGRASDGPDPDGPDLPQDPAPPPAVARGDQLTLRPPPLSSADALSLLLSWAALSHDAPLQGRLRAVAQRHALKGLLGTGKARSRGRTHGPQKRRQTEDPEEDCDREQRDHTLLADCKADLRAVFTHWESPGHAPGRDHTPSPGDGKDATVGAGGDGGLAGDTALLLTRWSLRSLLEQHPYQHPPTLQFLRWFQRAVTPHPATVDQVLGDAGAKGDLLRLYHRALEGQAPTPPSSRAETVELFTSVMLHLLEAQQGASVAGELHPRVLSACLPDPSTPRARREAGSALLSLYAYELWSGAQSPDLFLQHVGLVTTAANHKGEKRATASTLDQSDVGAICRDIVAGAEVSRSRLSLRRRSLSK
ncbi:hypothetical protein CRUP_011235 [Coryphaenoides rupestris]|nr:hypothetical protein CRUP_011235 [Coryphaenoides rupestris]